MNEGDLAMKIFFVRHGHPDYKNDCLTELGRKHAQAAAERLKNSGITKIYASTNGRAFETAEYTARELGLSITPYDFMREMRWGSSDGEPILVDGSPWLLAEMYASEGRDLWNPAWRSCDPFCRSRVVESIETVRNGIDTWLEELGYKREGAYYRVVGDATDKTVAMFSHGGSSSAALSHLFHIPFPQFCGMFHLDFTCVTVVELSNEQGKLVYPKLISSDANHIVGLETKSGPPA